MFFIIGLNENNGGNGGGVILAAFADDTRLIADYAPAAQSEVAMTSELDIVITPPAGTTKVFASWNLAGEGDTNLAAQGFIVFRDVGSGFILLPKSRDGSSNYYSVITPDNFDSNEASTPGTTSFGITDDSPVIGVEATYRVYCAGTHASSAGSFRLNSSMGAVGSSIETCLSSQLGLCLS